MGKLGGDGTARTCGHVHWHGRLPDQGLAAETRSLGRDDVCIRTTVRGIKVGGTGNKVSVYEGGLHSQAA